MNNIAYIDAILMRRLIICTLFVFCLRPVTLFSQTHGAATVVVFVHDYRIAFVLPRGWSLDTTASTLEAGFHVLLRAPRTDSLGYEPDINVKIYPKDSLDRDSLDTWLTSLINKLNTVSNKIRVTSGPRLVTTSRKTAYSMIKTIGRAQGTEFWLDDDRVRVMFQQWMVPIERYQEAFDALKEIVQSYSSNVEQVSSEN